MPSIDHALAVAFFHSHNVINSNEGGVVSWQFVQVNELVCQLCSVLLGTQLMLINLLQLYESTLVIEASW